MLKFKRLSEKKQQELLECFAADKTIREVVKTTSLNRKTVMRYYNLFRTTIASMHSASAEIYISELQVNEQFPLFEIIADNGEIDVQPLHNPKGLNYMQASRELDYDYMLFNYSKSKRFLLKHFTAETNNYMEKQEVHDFLNFTKRRLKKFLGLKKDDFYIHLKESEFRFNNRENLQNVLQVFMKKHL